MVGERNERSWNAVAQGCVERIRGGSRANQLETEAVRAVSWLLAARAVCCGYVCFVLAKPSSYFSHCWVDT